MRLDYKPFDFKATVEDASKGIIHAVVSVFDNVDSTGDVMVKGAFDQSIKAGEKKGKLPPGVWSHDWERPVAKTLKAWETDEGLNVLGQFNLETKDGQDAYSNVKNGLFTEYSFGFRRVKGGEEQKDGKNYVKNVDWYEWSPVLIGANRETYTASVKSAQFARFLAMMDPAELPAFGAYLKTQTRPLPTTERDFEEFLRDAGFSRSQAVAITSHGYKTLLRDAESADAGRPGPDTTPDDGQTPPPDEPATPDPDTSSETPVVPDDEKQADAQATVPTTTPEDKPKSAPYTLPDDVLPETAIQRQRITAMLHAQFLGIQGQATTWPEPQ